MQEITYLSSDGKTTIHAYIWHAYGEPKAVVQILHGMAEYALRYSAFAEFLAENGYTVCAEDHLGHGKSVTSEERLGYFAEEKGYKPVLADVRTLAKKMQGEYPGLPYIMFGHSMGSFFCRKYISMYGNELSGAIICGTGTVSSGTTKTAKITTKLVALFKGWQQRSRFINNLAFGSYNQRFEKRTPFDWLSKDEKNVDRYIKDKYCGTPFTCNAFYGLFDVISQACKKSTVKATPANLPVLIISGAEDPVGNYGKGVESFRKKLEKHVKKVKLILYKDCRHEILNDVCGEKVRQDVLKYLGVVIGR